METMYYIGLDVHKKTISFCIKDASGQIHAQGKIAATRRELDVWMKILPGPWMVAMEATMFTGWIYDHLLPHAVAVKVAHPLMLRAIAAAKKKNDRIDAEKLADCLRCDFRVLHGLNQDSRAPAHPAVSKSAGAPSRAAEKSHLLPVAGDRGELQPTEVAPEGLL
jgi:transposase